MKKAIIFIFLSLIMVNYAYAENVNNKSNNNSSKGNNMEKITIEINGKAFNASLYNNETADKFLELLPIDINMKELNGNEKYYYMPSSLPTNYSKIGNIKKGDIMLYGDNCIVIFYESFTSTYSYTKIGYIENTDTLKEALGKGSAKVVFKK